MVQRRELIGLSIGAFLLSLGVGWVFFSHFSITLTTFSMILIFAGGALVAVSLLSSQRPMWGGGRLMMALVLGIVVSLLLTSGVSAMQDIFGGGSGIYTAQETRMYDGAASERSVYFEVNNFNGPVIVSTWDRTSYSVNLTVRARDSVQGSAISNLAALKTSLNSSLVGGVRRLVLRYDVPLGVSSALTVRVDAFIPSAQLSLDLISSNGGIFLLKVNGTNVKISTSNGQLVFDRVYVDEFTGTTSNGRIEGTLDAGKATLKTSNGQIRLTIPGFRSGNYDLQTSNGAVDLTVSSSSSTGYSLDLNTSNGVITIDLPSLSYSEDQRTVKKAQTIDFSSRAIQLVIKAATSNGGIDLSTT